MLFYIYILKVSIFLIKKRLQMDEYSRALLRHSYYRCLHRQAALKQRTSHYRSYGVYVIYRWNEEVSRSLALKESRAC